MYTTWTYCHIDHSCNIHWGTYKTVQRGSTDQIVHRFAEVKAISETTPVPHETPRIQEVKQVNAKTCGGWSKFLSSGKCLFAKKRLLSRTPCLTFANFRKVWSYIFRRSSGTWVYMVVKGRLWFPSELVVWKNHSKQTNKGPFTYK